MLPRRLHLLSLSLILFLTAAAVAAWIALASLRDDPLPSLVWAPDMPDEALLALGPPVLNRLSGSWWWIETTPLERDKLRALGARMAVAMPQPIARMAGCSGELPVDPDSLRRPRQLP
ncbi:MAG: hypothetical protein EBT03_01915 [Betaproteobacteria bacterium]|nr:hypothetical protein [Betaproteobacteria bacterium]NBY14499.1 hypothetical protein [Betaproteobacteria bacterium]NCA15598.1 hypothetical protein [Betaproteobacteria bacterium]